MVGKHFHRLRTHPHRWPRMTAAIVLIVGGIFGWLPVLGFWMLPLGVILLSVDSHWVRRRRRRVEVGWGRSWLRYRLAGWWRGSRLRRYCQQLLGGRTF